jgi:tetratricopeptide (TPR) repeat protein
VHHHRHRPPDDRRVQVFNPCFKCGARQHEIEALQERRTAVARQTSIVRIGNLQKIELTTQNWAEKLTFYLSHCIELIGEQQPVIALGHFRLGDFFFRAGMVDKALERYQRAAPSTEKTWGNDDPKFADLLCATGLAMVHLGTAAKAIPLFDQALPVYEKNYGPKHPQLAACRYGLAKGKQAAKDGHAARDQLVKAVEILRASMHDDYSKLPGEERLETPWSPTVCGFNGRRGELSELLCQEALLDIEKASGDLEAARMSVERIEKLLVRPMSNPGPTGQQAAERLRKAKALLAELEKKRR